jgi:ribosomal protein S6
MNFSEAEITIFWLFSKLGIVPSSEPWYSARVMNTDIENGAGSTEQELEAGYNESRVYELGFHIDPELPQEEVKKTYQSLREKASTLVAEGEPQKIPLAYTISQKVQGGGRRDFDTAYFAWFAYEADGPEHEAIIEAAKAESRLIRYIDLRTDKETATHAAEMHEIYAKMGEKEQADNDVSDTELDAALKEAGV